MSEKDHSRPQSRKIAESRPDWGHGPKKPTLLFTEEEIRLCLDYHTPEAHWCNDGTAALYCSCELYKDWSPSHLLERLYKLREITDGRQASEPEDAGQRGSGDPLPA